MATGAAQGQGTGQSFTHLHYGGSVGARTGKLGNKPGKGTSFRKNQRLEMIARLESAQIPRNAIATMLVISINRLTHIMKSPDYLIARMAVTHGLILDNASKLEDIKQQRREMLTAHLPAAWQALVNELQRPAITIQDRKLKADIALEWMDREGTFAKVSRTEIKPVDMFDFERADAASSSLINSIRAVAPPTAGDVLAAVKVNSEFSNTRTLSPVEQQKALNMLEEAASELAKEDLAALPSETGEDD
jgi:hypothetical protein